MSDTSKPMAQAIKAMMENQAHFMQAYSDFWEKPGADSGAATGNLFDAIQEKMAAWSARMPNADWMKNKDVVSETMQRMMDPARLLFAGSDELNKTLNKLVEGPELSDIGTLERQSLKTMKEWAALNEANTQYQIVIGKAWTRAFEAFSNEVAQEPDVALKGSKVFCDRWFAIANDELIKTQRTREFLEAHRKLLRSGVEYRLREREMVEAWCEARSMPTRTEVDDLHKTVYLLRKEMRGLKKQLAAANPKKPGNSPTGRTTKNG